MRFDWQAVGFDPNAFIGSGAEVKSTCPACSHTRKKRNDRCCNVNVEEGTYHCWHCSQGGKAPEIERQLADDRKTRPVRGGTTSRPPPAPKPPPAKPRFKPEGLPDSTLGWFAERGITHAVLERNAIGWEQVFMPQLDGRTWAVAFPYFRGEEVVNVKHRTTEKLFRMATGAERLLYGHRDIDDELTVIVEGEMDKLSVEVAGISACVSVPDGAPAPGSKNIESKFDYLDDDRLDAVKTWVIAVDNDAPGMFLQAELIRRLGPERCKVVTWPDGCKDANDVLTQHGPRTLRECIELAKAVPITGVIGVAELRQDIERFSAGHVDRGVSTGWPEMDAYLRIKTGQLTVVTGIPGHGKSEWLDALCVNLASDCDYRVALFSPENYPVALHAIKLCEKAMGMPFNEATPQQRSRTLDWLEPRFIWVNPEDPTVDEVLVKARALVRAKGIRVLVIDPWNEIDHAMEGQREDQYIGQQLTKLRRFARQHDIAIFVVAHPRLMEKEKGNKQGLYVVPTPYAISGGAMWANKADNVVTVFMAWDETETWTEVHVQKVKFKLHGRPGMVAFEWDKPTGRYHYRLPRIRY